MGAVDTIELIIRGAAVGIYLVLTFQTLIWPLPSLASRLTAIVFLVSAVQSVSSIPALVETAGWWIAFPKAVGNSLPGFLWVAACAVFSDDFRWRWWKLLPALVIGCLSLLFSLSPGIPDAVRIIQVFIILPLLFLTFRGVRQSRPDDLVVSRVRLANALQRILPVILIAVAAVAAYEIGRFYHPVLRIIAALLLLGISTSLILAMTRMDSHIFPEEKLPEQDPPNSAAEHIDLQRILTMMEQGAFLNDRMTIGSLAQSLGIPEHRMRKLINRKLGHRNFTAFLNQYRIGEAKKRLEEPDLVHVQMTNLAFDIGYGSLAPFNRAFKEDTGMSPTEWRERALLPPAAG